MAINASDRDTRSRGDQGSGRCQEHNDGHQKRQEEDHEPDGRCEDPKVARTVGADPVDLLVVAADRPLGTIWPQFPAASPMTHHTIMLPSR